MTRLLVIGCIGFGLAAPWAAAQEHQTLQQAIQFQHLKDAADARQAALEAKHSGINDPVPAKASQSSADRMDLSQTGSADRIAPMFRTEPGALELQNAVAWERSKDAAAARQAAIDAQRSKAAHSGDINRNK